jgi:hypothetical protein
MPVLIVSSSHHGPKGGPKQRPANPVGFLEAHWRRGLGRLALMLSPQEDLFVARIPDHKPLISLGGVIANRGFFRDSSGCLDA